ncbi:MAG: DUF4286 family protein [Flavisolibacter sp.]
MNKKNNDLSLPFREAGGIIYNITTKVEATIANAWLQWLLDEHIPEILATKCFTNYKVVRLLEVDDSEGPTYAVQYHAESKADYNRYTEKHAATMRQKTFDRWGQQFIAFNSIMEVVK